MQTTVHTPRTLAASHTLEAEQATYDAVTTNTKARLFAQFQVAAELVLLCEPATIDQYIAAVRAIPADELADVAKFVPRDNTLRIWKMLQDIDQTAGF